MQDHNRSERDSLPASGRGRGGPENTILPNNEMGATNDLTKPRGRPTTKAGKEAVRDNAIRYGLRSNRPVIPELEDPDEWDRHLNEIIADLAPEGRLEREYAERVALCQWRLRRLARYETGVTLADLVFAAKSAARQNRDDPAAADPEVAEQRIYDALESSLIPDKREVDKIIRYEAHVHRQDAQAHARLDSLQSRRLKTRHRRTPEGARHDLLRHITYTARRVSVYRWPKSTKRSTGFDV